MDSPPHLHLDNTLGAALIGVIASAALWGITNVQTYMYFKHRGSDPKSLRLTVVFLWVLDTLHQILISHALYYYAVTMYGNPTSITVPTWSIMGVSDVTSFLSSIVEIGRNRVITIPILLGAVVVFVGSIIFATKG
ncbi:hypothetical protein CERSUDRAFT_95771 [Gelatoporia subvermispora B]|uniref:Uncharacterized protein n=1 Tax=Ceriporiopsis subvermispora (strain B) TaxID=914234 RepID=M2QHH0_CERS8|nr:hypothetical protein CERSUDRAFT_95771 [Gelatoporia subvermispora B]